MARPFRRAGQVIVHLVFTGKDGNNTCQGGSDKLLRRVQSAPPGVQLRTLTHTPRQN